jgi:glutathionylspermidine synthase
MMDWTVILGAGGASALILTAKEIAVWALNRKAQKNDKNEAKEDKFCGLRDAMTEGFEELKKIYGTQAVEISAMKEVIVKLDSQGKVQLNALQAQLGNTIKFLCGKYIKRGKITLEELSDLEHLYEVYHLCGGNGAITEFVCLCRQLKVVGTVPEG